jgi:predicted dehydrogenase
MRPIRIAMFSLNSVHAVQYIRTLPIHPDYEWVAVSVAPSYRRFANLDWVPSGVKIYETEEELLKAHPDLDAVIMAGTHCDAYRQTKLCVQFGIKNLLSMKVPTFDMVEYSELQQIICEKDIIFQIELEMRFDQTVRRMKELCDANAIGKLVSIQIYNTTVCVPPELLPWVTNPEKSYGRRIPLKDNCSVYRGGALSDHPHAFDLARFFSGSEFDNVYATAAPNIRPDRLVEDGVFVLGRMKNGVITSIDPSYSRHENARLALNLTGPGWEGYPKRVEVNIVLNGEDGSILGDCFHSGVYHTGKPYNTYAVQYVGGSSHYSPTLDAFANSVRNRIKPVINIDMHRKTIEVINACYDSIQSGMPINLD